MKRFVFGAAFSAFLGFGGAAALSMTMAEQVALQVLLMDHVEAASEDGIVVFRDTEAQEMKRFYAANLHPKIMDFGEVRVLCADFYDMAGERVEIDFIVVSEDGEQRISETLIGQRKKTMAQLVSLYGKPSK